MKAAVLDNQTVSVDVDYPVPEANDDEILVEVVQAGVCDTDLQLIQGYMGFSGIPGHEFVGVATAGRLAGQRVVGEINCKCGKCSFCASGMGTHCPQRSVLGILRHDGAFAEFVAVPEHNLHAVPPTLADDQAVFAEPVAAAFQIPQQTNVSKADRVVVLGDGRLGNLCAQVLRLYTNNLVVVGKHPAKLSILADLGLTTAPLSEIQLQRDADIVVDCTGSETGLATALQLVRPRGRIILKTTVAGKHMLSLAPIVIDEVTLIGSRCGPFGRALKALSDREIQVEQLITDRFPLDQIDTALKRAAEPDALKVILDVRDVRQRNQ